MYFCLCNVLVPNEKGKKIINIDHLVMNNSYRKALENVIKNEKIGLKSHLWTEKISEKLENIINNKFSIIYKKMTNFLMNVNVFTSVVEIINQEIDDENNAKFYQSEIEFEYFKRFQSAKGVIYDKWDSEYDLINEGNNKVC